MTLPPEKINKIKSIVKQIIRKKYIHFKDLESLNGKLRHAAMAMPWANGIFYPIIATLTVKLKIYRLSPNSKLTQVLQDFVIILSLAAEEPAPLGQLIPEEPDAWGFLDASKHGARGVWYSKTSKFQKFMWQYKFPPEIQKFLQVFN